MREWGLAGECASIGATRLAAPILCAPAVPLPSRETAPCGRSIVFLLAPICKRACMGANKKTIATFVTTVSRLGGEDKTFDIMLCETVQHNK